MSLSTQLAPFFARDLARLIQEANAFPDDETLWRTLPGATNSAGNLFLHLEGNLLEFIGRQLGNQPYQRQRTVEFSASGITKAEIVQRLEAVKERIPAIVAGLTPEQMAAPFPENVLKVELSTHQFLFHLYGHLSYHLGQIDYLRRILTSGSAVPFAGL